MTTRHRTRPEADAAREVAKHAARMKEHTLRSKAEPAVERDGVPYIPSDRFLARAREIAKRRAGLLKRLAE